MVNAARKVKVGRMYGKNRTFSATPFEPLRHPIDVGFFAVGRYGHECTSAARETSNSKSPSTSMRMGLF